MRPLVGSHWRLGAFINWAVGLGSLEKTLGAGGAARGMAGASHGRGGVAALASRVRRGPAVRPVVAGGSGGWSLMINWRPLISYPTAGKSNDQR